LGITVYSEYVEPTNNTPATLPVYLTTARHQSGGHIEHVTTSMSPSTSGRPYRRRPTSGDVIRLITLQPRIIVKEGMLTVVVPIV